MMPCGALGFKPAYLRKSICPYKHVSALFALATVARSDLSRTLVVGCKSASKLGEIESKSLKADTAILEGPYGPES